ncbi:MAG: DUF3179 domain-containing (seleno)protein [Acidimicrobiia bacterium]
MPRRLVILLILLVAACSSPGAIEPTSTTSPAGSRVDSDGNPIPPAPTNLATGPLSADASRALDAAWAGLGTAMDPAAVAALGGVGDVRVGWLLSDLLRFFTGDEVGDAALAAFAQLTGTDVVGLDPSLQWRTVSDYLIAWDLPAPPGYAGYKGRLFTLVEPGWQPFFDDSDADVDWRLISWGGVFIDDRPLDTLEGCPAGCIPALDDPPMVTGEAAGWYPDDGIVFGVTINGESRAYPKNIMEVHEMVNDTIGGRRIGMPYCTLCGSAQAFYTDIGTGDPLVLRTSGLLSRSNKVMYVLATRSMFDTFLGVAVSGPLQGLHLEQASVVTTTWGQWKSAHPDSAIVAEHGGRGITYPADPLYGRDDEGPIFPIGDVDPRLPVQQQVLGVTAPDGTPIAFPVAAALTRLDNGDPVVLDDVELRLDAGGLRAYDRSGNELASHQAFWFAWSQFEPGTKLWEG